MTLCVYHMVQHLVNSVPSSHISIQIKHWLGIYLCICFNLNQDTLLRSQLAVWQRINPAVLCTTTTSSHSPGGSFHFYEVQEVSSGHMRNACMYMYIGRHRDKDTEDSTFLYSKRKRYEHCTLK